MRQGTFFWLGLALLISSIGQAQEHVINLTQGTNIAVSLSPDKSFLVIDLTGQLWRLPLSGGTAIPLTPPTSIARNPRFSRDGKMIVYQREENLQWDLWIADLEEGTQHQLTKTEHNETDPDFSV
ncbi:MAG: DPP IV N-terminal domain-containing protein, partial [Gammaproteobacteria bacterium]|nr:DPP IV N-terminal domain-containing protein [Gammaproteobacteria bacterium]